MATRTQREAALRLRTRRAARQAKNNPVLRTLARAGFFARGQLYIVIGVIAVLIAFGKTNQQADKTGALHALGRTPAGEIALWLLAIGFFGMALWRLSEALFGTRGKETDRRKLVFQRLAAVGKGALYAALGYGVLEYALGIGNPPSSDQQSVDLTATLMRHPGGRVLVIAVGLAFIASGLFIGYKAWRKKFRDDLRLGDMGPRVRPGVEWLGRIGGIARGVVFITAGVFLVVAAIDASPGQAKGIDSALRALASTPLGPWLLVIVAIGLIMFGLYSWCEIRWRRV